MSSEIIDPSVTSFTMREAATSTKAFKVLRRRSTGSVDDYTIYPIGSGSSIQISAEDLPPLIAALSRLMRLDLTLPGEEVES